MENIVSSKWLNDHLSDSDLIILDASAPVNVLGKESEFENTRIKGARFIDLKNDFSDTESPYPNTLVSPEKFQKACRNLGINSSSKIIVYDTIGIYWSPRVWWMFKTMGHKNVAVLDGGLPDWIVNDFDTEAIDPQNYVKGNFVADFNKTMVSDFDLVLSNSNEPKALLIDARSQGRFNGKEPEPRKDLRSGHIPNSVNIPYESVLKNGKFKDKSELAIVFKEVQNDKRPFIFSCGSGITACIILLAYTLIMDKKTAVYDGSWTEWAQKVK